MNKEELFHKIKAELENKLVFLPDKPEENIESTVKALWLKASGISKSSEEAIKVTLPELTEQQVSLLNQFIEQRLNNIPLAYITGRQSFMGVELLCDNRALIPRKETEILGKAALEICKYLSRTKDHPLLLDICCGSGNLGIVLSILSPGIKVFSSDISQTAIELTNENIRFCDCMDRVIAKQGNMFEIFKSENFLGKVDIIVCNPPYISSAKLSKMDTEISRNEPDLAFDGGMLGTKIIQQLISEATNFLIKGGYLIFEVGLGQGSFISDLCKKNMKYEKVSTITDPLENIRVIECRA